MRMTFLMHNYLLLHKSYKNCTKGANGTTHNKIIKNQPKICDILIFSCSFFGLGVVC